MGSYLPDIPLSQGHAYFTNRKYNTTPITALCITWLLGFLISALIDSVFATSCSNKNKNVRIQLVSPLLEGGIRRAFSF